MTILPLLLTLFQAPAAPLQVPDLAPLVRQAAPNTIAELPVLREGIALYDQGKYEEAIARYEQILTANPENVTAAYELAQTYWRKKEYQKAIDLAAKATQYSSPALPQLYALIGNVLRTNLPGVREWLVANPERVNTFLLWSRAHQWPDKNSVDPAR